MKETAKKSAATKPLAKFLFLWKNMVECFFVLKIVSVEVVEVVERVERVERVEQIGIKSQHPQPSTSSTIKALPQAR
jgi:hypothetical protein